MENQKSLYLLSNLFLFAKLYRSSIERLGRPEVTNKIINLLKLAELSPGDLERRQEVDPLHDFITLWGSQ